MLSIIVPCYKAEKTLSQCLNALLKEVEGIDAEIIVVDNNSRDRTAEIARAAGVRVVGCDRQCAGAARNAGIAASRGEIICMTDSDCVPLPGWLKTISAPLEKDPALTATKGTYVTHQKELTARFVQLEYEDKYDMMKKHSEIDFIDTYSAAFRREPLLQEHGFDERLTWLEDQELSFRLHKRGCRMIFHPEAVVSHFHASSPKAYVRKKYLIGYWKRQVIRLHPDRFRKDTHTPQIMKIQMGLVILMPISLLMAVYSPVIASLALVTLILTFLLTTVPFVMKAIPKDLSVALISPWFLLLRAAALSAGYIVGIMRPCRFSPRTVTI